MALSKKHFIRIAAEIAAQQPVARDGKFNDAQATRASALYDVAANLASFFAEENSQFDRARFIKACGF